MSKKILVNRFCNLKIVWVQFYSIQRTKLSDQSRYGFPSNIATAIEELSELSVSAAT